MTRDLQADLASGELTDLLADICEAAAQVILPYWRNGVVVQTKGDDSPVTIADQKAEALILERLTALYPGVQSVAEEAVAADGAPAAAEEWFWLVDPLDGTKGFINGRESFSVNIGLIHGHEPVAGVVTAPATGTTWRTVSPGKGAERRVNGGAWEPISIRARPAEAKALLSLSVKGEEAERLAGEQGCSVWEAADSSLKFCVIAEGGADAYPRSGPTYEWDTAAGQAVLEAAGGRVLDTSGQRLSYAKPTFLNGPFLALGA